MKVLIVSPYFLPFNGVGALRMSSFAKYLLAQNDDISVLKLSNEQYPKEFLGQEHIDGIRYTNFTLRQNASFRENAHDFHKALDALLSQNEFDILICSCGPNYTLPATEALCQKYGVPFVLDYRDLWIHFDGEIDVFSTKIRHEIFKMRYKRFEKSAVESADLFATVTPICLDVMQKKYKIKSGHLIYNGYDDASLLNIERPTTPTMSTDVEICFFGKLAQYSIVYATHYLKAVKRLLDEGYNLHIKHIGENEEATQKILSELNFPKEKYTCTGRTSYANGMEMLMRADICAAVLNYARGLGTKVFDYIYVNKPIVAIAPKNGDFYNLLQKYKNAYICQNEEHVYKSLSEAIGLKETCLDEQLKIEDFSRSCQNKKYRDIMLQYLEKQKQA